MRDYSRVCPKFWRGDTGKAIKKKGADALIVAMYLITSPHSNMIGLYVQPLMYMAYETGLGEERARKGLADCIEVGFCDYDYDNEVVWVYEMGLYQIDEQLKPGDKRTIGIQREYDALPTNKFLSRFFEAYRERFWMTQQRAGTTQSEGACNDPCDAPSQPPSDGVDTTPSMGLVMGVNLPIGSQAQAQAQAQPPCATSPPHPEPAPLLVLEAQSTAPAEPAKKPPKVERGTSLPKDWVLPRTWGEWALQAVPGITREEVHRLADNFRDYWIGIAGAKGRKLDWEATWRNSVRERGPRMLRERGASVSNVIPVRAGAL